MPLLTIDEGSKYGRCRILQTSHPLSQLTCDKSGWREVPALFPIHPKLSECTRGHTARRQQGCRILPLFVGHTMVITSVNQSVSTGKMLNWIVKYITKYHMPEKSMENKYLIQLVYGLKISEAMSLFLSKGRWIFIS